MTARLLYRLYLINVAHFKFIFAVILDRCEYKTTVQPKLYPIQKKKKKKKTKIVKQNRSEFGQFH